MRHRRTSVAAPSPVGRSAWQSLRSHWPEYLIEAAALGIFMISAGAFTALLESPHSWLGRVQLAPSLKRAVIGLAMGGTAAGLIYSPWGQRSGAQMNPSITLTYLRLGRIPRWDAVFYILFQAAGGLAGVLLTAGILRAAFTQPPVNYVVTVPGPAGSAAAFAGELIAGAIMMGMILVVSDRPAIARFTGLCAGLLIACDVEFEAPLSGFGMNPARTLASALPSGIWTGLWIYLTAAPLGMLLAAQGYLVLGRPEALPCCKLHHGSRDTCIYCGRRSVDPSGPASASAGG
jgi:aquaporin Z